MRRRVRAAIAGALLVSLAACALDLGGGGPGDRVSAAFAVERSGLWLTAAHATEGCEALLLKPEGEGSGVGAPEFVQVVALDVKDDLALLRAAAPTPAVARFSRTRPEEGAPLFVAGYPDAAPTLRGAAVAARYDPSAPIGRRIGLEGPVRPGHSGGPALTPSGAVAGMVIQALDAETLQRLGRARSEFGLAVDGERVLAFLRARRVAPRILGEGAPARLSDPDGVGAAVAGFMARLECYEPD